jgi:nucleoside-triphosphatase THEP1
MTKENTKMVCVTVIETRTYKYKMSFSDLEEITETSVKQAIEEEIGAFDEIFDCENIIDENWTVDDVDIL